MSEVLVLNSSEKSKTVAALKAAAKKAKGRFADRLKALAEELAINPTAGRSRRKKETLVKKRTVKRAGARRKTPRARTNPSATAAAPRRNRAAAAVSSRLSKVDVMGLMQRGAIIAGGVLAQSFVTRQVEKFLPSLPKIAQAGLGSAVVAGGALMLAGGKGWAEDFAASAVAAGIQGIAREFAPGLFAGDDPEQIYVQGYEDGVNNYAAALQSGEEEQTYDDAAQMEGLAFSTPYIPDGIGIRPAALS